MTKVYPNKGSSTYKLLDALLNGRRMTVIDTLMEFNLMTPNARVSELRKAGWPIRSLKVPHPRLPSEEVVAYYMEAPFRKWWIDHGQTANPADYPYDAGRGKFGKAD